MNIYDKARHKILLITLVGLTNYGNRLQHYAMKTAIEKQGFSVTSLMIQRDPNASLKERFKALIMGMLKHYSSRYAQIKRTERFMVFNHRYIGKILYMSADHVRDKNWDTFQYAVTGSDQVWHNWHWENVRNELSFYYLDFMPEQKRVSYAPSFGFSEFPENDLEVHRRGLQGMASLSCREKEGCDLIFQLTGRKAEKVLDPTLLLTAEDWISLEKKPRCTMPEHYLVQFFLGGVPEEYQKELNRISEKERLQIINLQDVNNPQFYSLSPLEFIWLIHNADAVCTDSFHASVFAIMFERNLRVFARKGKYSSMFGRLHDLLEPLQLMDNVFGTGESMSTKLSLEARGYLEEERELSLDYLRKSLGKNG